MSIFERAKRKLRTEPEPAINGAPRRDDHFYEGIRRHGARPPNTHPEQYNGGRHVSQRDLDDASWGVDPQDLDELGGFDFSAAAEEARRIAVERETLQVPLPVIPPPEPTAPIEQAYEKLAQEMEKQLVEFRDRATDVIRNGLAEVAKVRQIGASHKERVLAELRFAETMLSKITASSTGLTEEVAHAQQASYTPDTPASVPAKLGVSETTTL